MGLHCIYMGSAVLQFKRNDFFTDVYSHPILPPPVSVLRLSPLVRLWPLIGSCTCHSASPESHLLLDEPAQAAKISQRENRAWPEQEFKANCIALKTHLLV